MKCILVDSERFRETGNTAGFCLPLFPLLDRPFLQHVVEHLAERRVTDVEFVLGSRADAIEALMGDGERWGCTFTYHLTRRPDRPARTLKSAAALAGDETVLVGWIDQLPELPDDVAAAEPHLIVDEDDEWTGWAVVRATDLADLPPTTTRADLERLLTAYGLPRSQANAVLKLRSIEDVPAAQRALLDKRFTAFCTAREVRPGVWLARNATVAASAELVPPVFIGENTAVTDHTLLGPYTVVGADCLLASGCVATNTTILPASYAGPGVGLNGVIVEGGSLIQPTRRTRVPVESHLLDTIEPPSPLAGVTRRLGRVLAAVVLVICLPLLAVAALWLKAFRPGPVFWPRRFVRQPLNAFAGQRRTSVVYTLTPPRENETECGWVISPTIRSVVLELIPGLWTVALGRLRLVGLPPRDEALIDRLMDDRGIALLNAPAGLVTEIALNDDGDVCTDTRLLADLYQAHTTTPRADLLRLLTFFVMCLTPSRAIRHATDVRINRPQSCVETALIEALPISKAETVVEPILKFS